MKRGKAPDEGDLMPPFNSAPNGATTMGPGGGPNNAPPHNEIRDYLNKNGFSAGYISPAEVDSSLSSGYYVFVTVNEQPPDGTPQHEPNQKPGAENHSILLTGFDGDGYQGYDPYRGHGRHINKNELIPTIWCLRAK